MTVGPMPCMGCGASVWWQARRFYEPTRMSKTGWRRHNCAWRKAFERPEAAARREQQRSADYMAGYKAGWKSGRRRVLAETGR